MNEISVFYDHILQASEQTKRDVQDIMEEVKAAGISALEIRGEVFRDKPRRIGELLRRTGLKVSCVYEFYDWGSRFDKKAAKRQLELAAEYGAKKILVVPGFLSEGEARRLAAAEDKKAVTAFMESSEAVGKMAKALAFVTSCAESEKVSVTLEDFDGSTAPYARRNQLLWFMENVPGLKYTFDMGNFAYSDEDAEEGLALLKKYVVHVHCKDRGAEPGAERGKINRGLKPAAVGEGYLPIEKMVRELVASGYEGCFAVEHFDAPDQLEFMKRSCENLKKFMGQ